MTAPKWILGAGWLVFLLYAYPGYLHAEGADQLLDSRVGAFTDWQPPIMTEVWRIVGWFIAGPAGLLVLQSGLLLFGTYLLARRCVSDRAAAIIAACVLVVPPTMVTSAQITPEALLAGLLVAGSAALLDARAGIRLAGLALVALACGMHDSAAWAALPLVAALFTWRAHDRPARRIALALAAWFAAVAIAWGVSSLLVDTRTERNEVVMATRDITGTLALAPDARTERLRELLEGPVETQQQRDRLFAARRALMRDQPGAYLAYRGKVFLRTLGLFKDSAPVYTEVVAEREHAAVLQHLARHSLVQRSLIAAVRSISSTPLMRPYLYVGLATVLVALALVRGQRVAAVLLASGLVYEASLLVTTSRVDYRDSHWLIVATIAAGGLVVAASLKARHERIAE